jgi:menaquinone-dependent protoporphyrinogen oxidase
MSKPMKTIIVYATKYGYTGDCVQEMKRQLQGDVLTVNILTDKISSLEAFDNVILGGSIYMGQVQKKLKAFCESNMNSLLTKRVALFLCCGLPENFEQHLIGAFPSELREKAIACECFGGELRTDKMKGPDRIISGLMKKVASNQGKAEVVKLPENIVKLVSGMNINI